MTINKIITTDESPIEINKTFDWQGTNPTIHIPISIKATKYYSFDTSTSKMYLHITNKNASVTLGQGIFDGDFRSNNGWACSCVFSADPQHYKPIGKIGPCGVNWASDGEIGSALCFEQYSRQDTSVWGNPGDTPWIIRNHCLPSFICLEPSHRVYPANQITHNPSYSIFNNSRQTLVDGQTYANPYMKSNGLLFWSMLAGPDYHGSDESFWRQKYTNNNFEEQVIELSYDEDGNMQDVYPWIFTRVGSVIREDSDYFAPISNYECIKLDAGSIDLSYFAASVKDNNGVFQSCDRKLSSGNKAKIHIRSSNSWQECKNTFANNKLNISNNRVHIKNNTNQWTKSLLYGD